jgi:hypothetical protein
MLNRRADKLERALCALNKQSPSIEDRNLRARWVFDIVIRSPQPVLS